MNDGNNIQIYKGIKKGDIVIAKQEIKHTTGFHMKKGTEGVVEAFQEVYKRFSSRHKPEVYGKDDVTDRHLLVVRYNCIGKNIKTSVTIFAKHSEVKKKKAVSKNQVVKTTTALLLIICTLLSSCSCQQATKCTLNTPLPHYEENIHSVFYTSQTCIKY